MIQRLGTTQIQNNLEHFSVVDIDLNGESIRNVDNIYQLVNINAKPISYKTKNVDMLGFPGIFSYGIGGQNSSREVNLQPKMYEKTRLMSGNNAVRRNMQYLFYLLQNSEKK